MKKLIRLLTYVLLSIGLFAILLWKVDLKTGMMSDAAGEWTVGLMILQNEENEFDITDKLSSNDFITIPTSSAVTGDSIYFLADPFLFRNNDTTYVFVETQPFGKSGAYICAYRISDDLGEIVYLGVALKERFHLSYPQVIEVGKEIFLIPETQGGDSSFVYKSKNFPLEWQKSGYLLSSRIKDPTLVPKDENSGNLFYAENGLLLKSTYKYDGNDIRVEDRKYVKTGTAFRPGGSPFYVNGKLYLPIQDNSDGYGTNLVAGELNPENGLIQKYFQYLLKPNKFILPFGAGMHHISSIQLEGKKIVAFDGRYLVSEKKDFNLKFFLKYNYLNIWDSIFGSSLEPWYPFNE
jgi:hypothetical protein